MAKWLALFIGVENNLQLRVQMKLKELPDMLVSTLTPVGQCLNEHFHSLILMFVLLLLLLLPQGIVYVVDSGFLKQLFYSLVQHFHYLMIKLGFNVYSRLGFIIQREHGQNYLTLCSCSDLGFIDLYSFVFISFNIQAMCSAKKTGRAEIIRPRKCDRQCSGL